MSFFGLSLAISPVRFDELSLPSDLSLVISALTSQATVAKSPVRTLIQLIFLYLFLHFICFWSALRQEYLIHSVFHCVPDRHMLPLHGTVLSNYRNPSRRCAAVYRYQPYTHVLFEIPCALRVKPYARVYCSDNLNGSLICL